MRRSRNGRYSKRRTEKWVHSLELYREREKEIQEYASDILNSKNFHMSREHIQHGNMTVHEHARNVARYSLALSIRLGIDCDRRDLVRGALLHDYFLYDWHIPDEVNPHRLHGFYHPGRALKNASAEYELTRRQEEIIKKHMWPLTVVPPMCREAWIVTAADKWCSLLETVHMHKGHGAVTSGQDKE